jgi:hypothetical protein
VRLDALDRLRCPARRTAVGVQVAARRENLEHGAVLVEQEQLRGVELGLLGLLGLDTGQAAEAQRLGRLRHLERLRQSNLRLRRASDQGGPAALRYLDRDLIRRVGRWRRILDPAERSHRRRLRLLEASVGEEGRDTVLAGAWRRGIGDRVRLIAVVAGRSVGARLVAGIGLRAGRSVGARVLLHAAASGQCEHGGQQGQFEFVAPAHSREASKARASRRADATGRIARSTADQPPFWTWRPGRRTRRPGRRTRRPAATSSLEERSSLVNRDLSATRAITRSVVYLGTGHMERRWSSRSSRPRVRSRAQGKAQVLAAPIASRARREA